MEKNFFCVCETYVKEPFSNFCAENSDEGVIATPSPQMKCCGCVNLSDDVNVFAILLATDIRYIAHKNGVVYVVKHSYYNVEEIISALKSVDVSRRSSAMAFCIGGRDFKPALHRVRHENLVRTFLEHGRAIGPIEPPIEHKMETLHTFVCLPVLCSRGNHNMVKDTKSKEKGQETIAKVSNKELPSGVFSTTTKYHFI